MVHSTKKGVEKISLSSISSKQSKKQSKTKQDYLRTLKISVRIGKEGLTENTIKEIKRQFKKNKTIKIKILKSAFSNVPKKELFKSIEDKTDSKILKSRGFVLILSK